MSASLKPYLPAAKERRKGLDKIMLMEIFMFGWFRKLQEVIIEWEGDCRSVLMAWHYAAL